MTDQSAILQIVEKVGAQTAMLEAAGRRIDDMAGALRDLASEKSHAHKAIHDRIDALEDRVDKHDQWQARVYGIAVGIGIGSGLGASWLVNVLAG